MYNKAMDNNGQLTFEDTPLKREYKEGLNYIRKGDFFKALKVMETILEKSIDFPGIEDSVRSLMFWTNRWDKVLKFERGLKRAQLLINEWNTFETFVEKNKINFEEIIINLKNYIFKKIIKNLIIAYQSSDVPDIEILLKIGKIFIAIDEIDRAIETFEYARMFKKENSLLLSMLAEAYNRKGNFRRAKILFKEAFFYAPEQIDFGLIKADYILGLRAKLGKIFADKKLIAYWLPVYAEIYNILDVKRELAKAEIEKLLVEVESLEKEYEIKKFSNKELEPKLINKYFWIIDYYKLQNFNDEYANVFKEKLKNINIEIYNMYMDKESIPDKN